MSILNDYCLKHIEMVGVIASIEKMLYQHDKITDTVQEIIERTHDHKFRKHNFPEKASEHILRLILWRKTGIKPEQALSGDVSHNGKLIEVKSFTSTGPSSFGPKEKWDVIYFMDMTNLPTTQMMTVYEVNLPMTSNNWQNLKVNKKETIGKQQGAGRRPRITFCHIKKQLPPECINVYFSGKFEDIFFHTGITRMNMAETVNTA